MGGRFPDPLAKDAQNTFALALSLGLAALATGCAAAPDDSQIVDLEHTENVLKGQGATLEVVSINR